MLGIMTGAGAVIVQLVLLVVAIAMAWWIAQSIMKKSWVALLTSLAASAVVAWALWGGGLVSLGNIAGAEAEDYANSTTATTLVKYVDF